MAWFKVEDTIMLHPKVVKCSNTAMGLWLRCAGYCCQHLTDGFVPGAIAEMLSEDDECQELIKAGLWIEEEDGYQFHDWHEYQQSAEEIENRRRYEREKKRRQRAAIADSTKSRESRGDKNNVPKGNNKCPQGSPQGSPRDVPTPDTDTDIDTDVDITSPRNADKVEAPKEPPREDVETLCQLLHDHAANESTAKPPQISKRWRDAARLLMDKDGVPFDRAVEVLHWATNDNFWASNILSMPKFRKQFPKIESKMNRSKKPAAGNRVAGYAEAGARLRKRMGGAQPWEIAM